MPRRSVGFISKRPHRKSRGGCKTCKKKKVKCDENFPICGYCELRKLECFYPQTQRPNAAHLDDAASNASSSEEQGLITYGRYNTISIDSLGTSPGSDASLSQDERFDFLPLQIPSWLAPVMVTSSGQLNKTDIELLHHYKTNVWQTLTVRDEEAIHHLNRDYAPHAAVSHSYLLYSMLSVSANHSNSMIPSTQARNLANVYRQKSLAAYTKALQNITNDNYETLLMTSVLMQIMVPMPETPRDDTAILNWVNMFLSMTQGLRILAGLKWASGIEKLAVFPIFKRELHPLPPPPDILLPPHQYFYSRQGPPGETPQQPNAPALYSSPPSPGSAGVDMSDLPFRPKELMRVDTPDSPPSWNKSSKWELPAPAFLPPPLMALLQSIAAPNDTGPIDIHRSTLVPVLHALSPIFLSLYHYHLNPDLFVRIVVYPTFLMPEFLALVREKEPRSLVIIGWWFAFVKLLPSPYWQDIPRALLQTVSNIVIRQNSKILMDAVEGAYRIVRVVDAQGKEAGAKSVFAGWEGVYWEAGGHSDVLVGEELYFDEGNGNE